MEFYLRSLNILPTDLKVPVSFSLSPAYTCIQEFFNHFNLKQEELLHIITNHGALIYVV